MRALLNAQEGQPYSLITLSGDRDAIFGYYLSHGFEQAKVEVKQQAESADAEKTDVTLNVTEGEQVFVDRVLRVGDCAHAAVGGGARDDVPCGRSAG